MERFDFVKGEKLRNQLKFVMIIDEMKNIFRRNLIIDGSRRENDAEHAWHMAMMIYLLKEYSNKEIDVAKAMMMALIHDIVEIDAGDTYAYDTDGLQTQKEREQRAAERIFGMLPEDQCSELRALFEEFEACESAEARFAKAMDNFQPLLLNHANGGMDWRAHKVTKTKVVGRQNTTALGSEKIWEYTEEIINENVDKGNIKNA